MIVASSQMSPWVSVRVAASHLGFSVVSLRRVIERNARRSADGGIEATFDGLRAKKLGRTWRVALGDRWAAGVSSAR